MLKTANLAENLLTSANMAEKDEMVNGVFSILDAKLSKSQNLKNLKFLSKLKNFAILSKF